MALEPGTRLGSYEITSLIDSGGMGAVYRAHDSTLPRDVAIKVLPATFTNDPTRLARFEREARILATLNHPHIAAIYGVAESNGVRGIVLEFVDGETLAARLRRGPVPLGEALAIAQQVADALAAAHEQGIIHRDLKPANIKVRPDGTVKVLDFGLAKETTAAAQVRDSHVPTVTLDGTKAGAVLGTAAYMSPEQAAGKPVDRRTDLWAFGVVLMEMLTGRPVFEGETVSHVLASVLKSEPDWTTLPATTPASVRKLLRRCLEKDRKRRLDSAAAAGLEIDEASAAPEPRATSALPQRSRTRVTVAWSAAMLAIVGLVGALTEIALSLRSRSDNLASQFVVAAPEGTRLTNPFNSLAVSPDGSKLVFAAAASGVSRLWIRPFDSLTARPLAGTEEGTGPFWSPDSRFLGFFARGKLRMIDAAGGPVQPLADVTTVGMGRELSGTWGPDGAIVFTPTTAGNLFLVRIGRGGTAAPITRLDESRHEVRHLFPAFLPDGRHFLFVARSIPEANSTINVGELGSSQTRPIRPAVLASPVVYAPPGYLIFRQASALMAQAFDTTRWSVKGDPVPIAEQVDYGPIGFSVSKSGTLVYAFAIAAKSELVWVDRTGKTITAIAPPAIYNNIALSRDEKQLAFDRPGTNPSDVWLLDLPRRILSRVTQERSTMPIWSPDGQTVAFATSRSGALDIYQRPSDASRADEPLLKLGASNLLLSDWSLDGRFLTYYLADPKTQLDVWVLPLFGDRKPFPFLHQPFNEFQGQFSPDGKWMAYVTDDESGHRNVFVQSFPQSTGKLQISADAGGTQPRWRRDGRELFYLAEDRKLMAVAIKTTATLEAETPKVLFETTLRVASPTHTYAVSADGQRFLLNRPADGASPRDQPWGDEPRAITVVLNWSGLLKR